MNKSIEDTSSLESEMTSTSTSNQPTISTSNNELDLEKGNLKSSELKFKSGDGIEDGEVELKDEKVISEQIEDDDGVVVNENGIPVVRSDNITFNSWLIVIIISSGSFAVACGSSMIASTYPGMEESFQVSELVSTLGLSIFVLGLGFAPLLLGPLSEFYGRRNIYLASYVFFIIFNFMVAFSNNITTFLIARFFVGCSGAAFLSVAGGSVSDIFSPKDIGAPMAVYTSSPFLGPVFGPVLSGIINQNLPTWRWSWYILIIWSFGELLLLYFFVPETYLPARLVTKAKLLRKNGRTNVKAPLELDERSVARVVLVSCKRPFELLATEPMALMLNIWTAILLGILYAFFSAFGLVYSLHGFDVQSIGLSFLGIGIGIITGTAAHPIWAGYYKKVTLATGKRPPPEEHLRKGMAGAVITPIALYWFAFTVDPSIHWSVSLLATIPFGLGIAWCFQAIFSFLVDAYRPVAASAMASNSALRSTFAAGFPLFTNIIFVKLGNRNALVLFASLTLAMVPLPFLFFYRGARYRRGSKFANKEA